MPPRADAGHGASPGVDIVSPGRYLDGIPHEAFAELRATPGLVWHPYQETGFWTVTRYADVKAVSMAPKLFSSGIGHTNLWDLEADACSRRDVRSSTPTPPITPACDGW